MDIRNQIQNFLKSKNFGVIGASKNREKYGNKVLRCYIQHNKNVTPINPNETEIENLKCVKNVSELNAQVESVSLITPPHVTEKVVEEIVNQGKIKNIWMQPGSESAKAVAYAQKHNLNVIADGSCILVVLGFRE